jgi:hypothetical protein
MIITEKAILTVQFIYYFFTAFWPLVHIKSFMAVTGPKKDVWLVKTVALLLLAICSAMLTSICSHNIDNSVKILCISCCIVLSGIDIYFVRKKIISIIYLADAAAEIILLAAWLAYINYK